MFLVVNTQVEIFLPIDCLFDDTKFISNRMFLNDI